MTSNVKGLCLGFLAGAVVSKAKISPSVFVVGMVLGALFTPVSVEFNVNPGTSSE